MACCMLQVKRCMSSRMRAAPNLACFLLPACNRLSVAHVLRIRLKRVCQLSQIVPLLSCSSFLVIKSSIALFFRPSSNFLSVIVIQRPVLGVENSTIALDTSFGSTTFCPRRTDTTLLAANLFSPLTADTREGCFDLCPRLSTLIQTSKHTCVLSLRCALSQVAAVVIRKYRGTQ